MNLTRKLVVALALAAGVGVLGLAGPANAAVPADAATPVPVAQYDDAASPSGVDVVTDGGEGVEEADPGPFVAAKFPYGGAITRATVLKRAKDWYNRNVQYSQSNYAWDMNHGKKYRTDCSGFVSMAWGLTTSRTTRTLSGVSTKIAWSALQPGDIVLRASHHVQLFEKWANSAHTRMWVYEEGNPSSDMNHFSESVSSVKNAGFVPYRYKKIK